jgi:hypothetical protein
MIEEQSTLFHNLCLIDRFCQVNVSRIRSLASSFPMVAVPGPAKLPVPRYTSLGPMMCPATAEAAVTAGLAR